MGTKPVYQKDRPSIISKELPMCECKIVSYKLYYSIKQRGQPCAGNLPILVVELEFRQLRTKLLKAGRHLGRQGLQRFRQPQVSDISHSDTLAHEGM